MLQQVKPLPLGELQAKLRLPADYEEPHRAPMSGG
jgi:hypothetical protein